MFSKLRCSDCDQLIPHDRGYLQEHYIERVRGELAMGTGALCPASNTKPPFIPVTVHYEGQCSECHQDVSVDTTEKYPGSLNYYGGTQIVDCPHCATATTQCATCGDELVEVDAPALDPTISKLAAYLCQDTQVTSAPVKMWVSSRGNDHLDGTQHEPVPVAGRQIPVQLKDLFVISSPEDEDQVPTGDTP